MIAKNRVIVVEDEPIIARFVRCILEELGQEVLFCLPSADDALKHPHLSMAEIAFLDINILGAKDGIGLARELKSKNRALKVIFITAHTDSDTIKEAADVSPSFFLAKPFDAKNIEIALRISVEKRCEANDEGLVRFEICKKSGAPMRDGEYIQISPMERKVLSRLLAQKECVVSYEELCRSASEDAEETSYGSLRNMIMRLRKKLPELKIETVKDIGYKVSACDTAVIL